MTLTEFIEKLKTTPDDIKFQDTMNIIEDNYTFEPTRFTNGDQENKAGENSGSCKLFSFAKLNDLDTEETLHCFGQYYKDVLETPNGNDHQNIRNFMKTGWSGISFSKQAITDKDS